MELAVKVMRDSIDEPRKDGKPCPKVGAVLWKPDGSVETAARGELRYGDHAEFTLLERKNRHCALDGSVLFTTLEPCAPGARNPPKKPCAERIVSARIKSVWIGIGDPDPTVANHGIRHLQDHRIEVRMFDRDLQEAIEGENREYLTHALERAQENQNQKSKPVLLSKLERAWGIDTSRLQKEALNRYRSNASIGDKIGSDKFNDRLVQLGLLRAENGHLAPTGYGLLLFGDEPRVAMPQAGLLATIRYPDGKEETRDFDEPLVLVPNLVEDWLRNKLPNVVDRSAMERREVSPLPFELMREAIVNALVHRDYDIAGAKCQLIVTADTITIKSPGAPLPQITLQHLQAFDAPMLSRNPTLHYVFAKMGMAEERGLGLKSFKEQAEKYGLPRPKYSFEDPYLVLTLFRYPSAATRALPEAVLESLSDAERRGWQWFATRGKAKSAQYAKVMGLEERTARRHLNHFLKLGLVRRIGSARATEYETK